MSCSRFVATSLFALAMFAAPGLVSGNSSGLGIPCDVDYSPLGNINRDKNAINPNNASQVVPMWWTLPPKFANDLRYTLRAGDGAPGTDQTSYTPGQYTEITIRSNLQDKQFTGLLMYAENDAKQRVGEWLIPPRQSFQIDPASRCITHSNADPKKYKSVFRVKFPANTGRVTIKALVKYGLAFPEMQGEFYWPNSQAQGHLKLNEGSQQNQVWFQGSAGQSCNQVCQAVGGTCDLPTMQSIGSSSALLSAVAKTSTCFGPMMKGCGAYSPTAGTEGCWYQDSTCTRESVTTDWNPCTLGGVQPFVPGKIYQNDNPNNPECCTYDNFRWCTKYYTDSREVPVEKPYNGGPWIKMAACPKGANPTLVPPQAARSSTAMDCTSTKNSNKDGQRLCACAGVQGTPGTTTTSTTAPVTTNRPPVVITTNSPPSTTDPADTDPAQPTPPILIVDDPSEPTPPTDVSPSATVPPSDVEPNPNPNDPDDDTQQPGTGTTTNRPGTTPRPGSPLPIGSGQNTASHMAPHMLCTFLTVLAGAVMSPISRSSRAIFTIVAVIALLGNVPGSSAHNWLTSPSRGNGGVGQGDNLFNGNTAPPCPPKGTRVHAQVRAGQRFQMEWASGHGYGSSTYLAVIKANDEASLNKLSFEIMDDYIKNAPPNANIMTDSKQYHVVPNTRKNPLDASMDREITPFARPANFRKYDRVFVYSKKASATAGDRRVAYSSMKYPYLIAVHRFALHEDHPEEMDGVEMSIPEGSPSGQYVVQYQWRGYYDCMDINVLDGAISNPVADVYGSPLDDKTGMDKYLHTMYTPTLPEYEALTGQGACRELVDGDSVEKCTRFCLDQGDRCTGVTVAPATLNTAVVKFKGTFANGQSHLPPSCTGIAKNPNNLVCYSVKTGRAPAVGYAYKTVSDPEDPVFYMTTYIRKAGWKFTDPCATCNPPLPPADWRFSDKCISCSDVAKNYFTQAPPKWTFIDNCQHCDNTMG